jgi:AcrR family transcriptional regulator
MRAQATQAEPARAVGSSHDRILAAAKQLFASRGYENTSTVAIARTAGTSESQLMKHFGSKEGLLEAIFDQGWERMGGALRGIPEVSTPAEKLLSLLDALLSALERDPELKELMLFEGRRVRKEGRIVLLTRGYQEFVKMVDSLLLEMRAAGELGSDANPQTIRSGLIGMLEGLLRDQLLARRVDYPAAYTAEEIRKLFINVLGALRESYTLA